MRSERGWVVVLAAALAVALLTGAAVPGGGGVAVASHGPEDANYTVVPLGDRSPGATDVRYGQRVVATAGTDLATLEQTTATYEEGSWSSCGPSDGETFGIDRGSTMDGYEVDESLQNNVKTFSAGEDVFSVEYNGEDDVGASTHFDDGDEFISVATCIDNPDEPGWYRISGTTTGITESGERVTFSSESHYFWICDCENGAEARERLGPPPSEPQPTATPTRTPDGGDGEPETVSEGSDAGSVSESQSQQPADPTPTGTTDGAGPEPTATVPSTAAPAERATGETASGGGAGTPTEAWDERVLETPTAGDGAGFGPAAALLALLAALLLARRRV